MQKDYVQHCLFSFSGCLGTMLLRVKLFVIAFSVSDMSDSVQRVAQKLSKSMRFRFLLSYDSYGSYPKSHAISHGRCSSALIVCSQHSRRSDDSPVPAGAGLACDVHVRFI